jgi:hypothetical protein
LPRKLIKLPLRDLLKLDLSDLPTAHVNTINKSLNILSAIVAHAVREGKMDRMPSYANPFQGIKLSVDDREAEGRDIFEAADLKAIFSTPVLSRRRSNSRRCRQVHRRRGREHRQRDCDPALRLQRDSRPELVLEQPRRHAPGAQQVLGRHWRRDCQRNAASALGLQRHGAQEWRRRQQTRLVNPQSGRCLNVAGGSIADGARLEISDCDDTAGQVWGLP